MKMSVCGHLVVRIDALEAYGQRRAVRIMIDRLEVSDLRGRSQYFSWQSNISTNFMTQRQSGSGVLSAQTHTRIHKEREEAITQKEDMTVQVTSGIFIWALWQ